MEELQSRTGWRQGLIARRGASLLAAVTLFTVSAVSALLLGAQAEAGLSCPAPIAVQPPFDADYTCVDLGSVPGLPPLYGGLTFLAGDPNTILIGGEANRASGALYSIGVVRDASNHITGFSGTATRFADAAYNDGGVAYGPDGVLFLARWPVNELGQTKSGSTITDKVIDLDLLGVVPSPGGLNFVPSGFPGTGQLKLVSWAGGEWYAADFKPDGSGTFDINSVTHETTIIGGPEGFIYVPPGSPQFTPFDSMLVAEYSAGNIAAYELDDNGDPETATRRDFITGLTGAEGAVIDPLTGDFLFSTFGGGDRMVVVQGFAPPATETPTPTATETATPTDTPTPTPPRTPTNPQIVKDPELANLWLCNIPGAPGCANKESGVEEVNLDVYLDQPVTSTSPKGEPQSIGSFEFEVRYDSKFVIVDWEPGELAALMECGKLRQENALQIACVTKGKPADAPSGPGVLATLRVRATADVYSILIANQQNGIATQLINQGCQLADLQGHPIKTDVCGDAAITIRYLEGDIHADCAVDVTDQQQIAFRWGARLGNLLYNSRLDLEPSAPKKGDGDIDAKDLQFVFGRHGSTCKDPHPPQPPVDPKAPLVGNHDVEILGFAGSASTPGETPQTYRLRFRNNSPVAENVQVGFGAGDPSLDPATITMAPGPLPPGSGITFGPAPFSGFMAMALSVPLGPGQEAEVAAIVTFPVGFGAAEVNGDVCHAGDPFDAAGRGFSRVGVNCLGGTDGFLDADPANDLFRIIEVIEGPKVE